MTLPHVMRFNAHAPEAATLYHGLALSAGLCSRDDSIEVGATALTQRVKDLVKAAGFSTSFADCGVQPEHIPVLAAEAATQWTAQFNPREVTAAHFADLYRVAVAGA